MRHIVNVEAETLVDIPADTLSETDVVTIGDTLGNLKSEQLTHTLTETLENAETWRLLRGDQDSGQNAGF